MDNQDHKKNHAPGHEIHGVHVCNKCGWPFPNPHPSARHRRAHRKICGAIEGYKLVDSEGTAHLVVSDDEHPSDEDRRTPSPKHLERINSEKGSRGVGERSNRSEDEVFSDAVAEFLDGGSARGIEEHPQDVKEPATKVETISENHTMTTHAHEDVPPPCNSADSIQMQNTKIPKSNLSGSALESRDHVSSASIGLIVRSLIDCGAEDSANEPSDGNVVSAWDLNPIKLEAQTDASQENKKNNAAEDLTETDAKGNEGTSLDRHLLDVVVSPRDNAGETFEAVSKLGKTEDIISDPTPAAGVVPLKEEHNDELVSKLCLSNLSPEAKSTEHVDTAHIKVDPTQGMDSASSGNSVESHNGRKEGNENMFVLSVSDAVPVVENAEIMIRGFKDHEGGKFPRFVNVDSFELTNDVKDSVSEDNPFSFHSKPLNEGTKVFASDMHVLKEDLEQKDGNSKLVVEESSDEGEADVLQTKMRINENQSLEESGALKDAVAVGIERSHNVLSAEDNVAHDYCKDSSLVSSPEHATKVISDMNPMVAPTDAQVGRTTNLFGMDDAGDNGKPRIERCDVTGNDDKKRITEESCGEKIIATSEPVSVLSECEANARINLLGDDNDADHEEDKTERFEISGTETGKGDSASALVDENLSGKTKTTPESASNLHAASVNAINVSEGKLPEPGSTSLDRVSDTQESVKELESDGNDKLPVHCVGGVSTAAQSNNGGDVQVLLKSSEDHMIREPLISPLHNSSSIRNSATVEDIHDRDFVGVTSGNRSESLPNEGDNNLVAYQLGASGTDFSVDSSSQTDSLEGHWGSVSVLSIQSDVPAIVETEHLPSNGSQASAEAEKASLKKPLTVSEMQHSDKSDVFEPPSFMTLVEPRDGGDEKAAASEIQTAQNHQQPKAGWFPSITHAVNESQGRKKNQEIIAKVTNWSTGRQQSPLKSQHIPLKSLLSEVAGETKSKSPNAKESLMPAVQKDETTAKDNGVLTAKVSSTLGPQAAIADPANEGEGKEWNSPARYPADIKREKRKVKGRPYWAQFVCCLSVN